MSKDNKGIVNITQILSRRESSGAVSDPSFLMMTHKYISQRGSEGKFHSKTFHLLVVCSTQEEELVEHSVFKKFLEEVPGKSRNRLVS